MFVIYENTYDAALLLGQLVFHLYCHFLHGCELVTTNSSRLYKFLPSMLLLLIIIYSTMLENVGKYYLTTCKFVIRLQPISSDLSEVYS